jgi:hypothetical protein
MKMAMTDEQWSEMKVYGKLNVIPNESSVKVWLDMETNEISWEDPNELIENILKKEIASCLKQKEETMSNLLFDYFQLSYMSPKVIPEARPFIKKLLFALDKLYKYNKTRRFWRSHHDDRFHHDGKCIEIEDKYNRNPLLENIELDKRDRYNRNLSLFNKLRSTENCGKASLMCADGEVKILLESGGETTHKRGKTASELFTECLQQNHVDRLEALYHKQLGADKNSDSSKHSKKTYVCKMIPTCKWWTWIWIISKPVLYISLIFLFIFNIFFLELIMHSK